MVIKIRNTNINDIDTYFNWANDDSVRELSFNSAKIPYKEHQSWFNNKLIDSNCFMFIFSTNTDIGQVRIQKVSNKDAIINISLDEKFRGNGYGVQMLKMSTELFRSLFPEIIINAYIKIENIASKSIFEKSGFTLLETLIYKNINSYHYINV
jgi:RimJ/RimL family protein N-acetyltransferase